MTTLRTVCIAALAALFFAACSTRQGYNITQTWQRNECQKLTEQLARERCLQREGGSHESYEKQREQYRMARTSLSE
jgi:hypothetical protein